MGNKKHVKARPNTRKKVQSKNGNMFKGIIMTVVCLTIILIFLMLNPSTRDMFLVKALTDNYEVIKFSELYNVTSNEKTVSEKIKALDGQKVKIRGFMAEQSPVDESFIYLVNAPFTVCPFCVITDSTKLEVLTVYMANKSPIKYTTEPVEIVGNIEVVPKADKVFGETTQFRIYADKIKTLKGDGTDKQVLAYFNQMNRDKVIALINVAYVNAYRIVPTYVIEDTTISEQEKYEYIKQWYFPKDTTGDVLEYIAENIRYLEERLELIKKMNPTNSKIKEINDQLIKLFEGEIEVFKDANELCLQIKDCENSEQITRILERLQELSERNKMEFENFTKWNNMIRES